MPLTDAEKAETEEFVKKYLASKDAERAQEVATQADYAKLRASHRRAARRGEGRIAFCHSEGLHSRTTNSYTTAIRHSRRRGVRAVTHETALALFAEMPPAQKTAVLAVFAEIIGAFPDVREAFVQAVIDECLVTETEMLLLRQNGAIMQ